MQAPTSEMGRGSTLEAYCENLQPGLWLGKLQIWLASVERTELPGGEPVGRHLASFSSRVQLTSQRAQFTCTG